jgi:hypothetical protein
MVADGVSDLLASFNGTGNGNGHRPATPPVTDEDRTTFGLLLDRAAERGLLTQSEYQVRLGELAEATSRDEMRRIVTELPVFVTPLPVSRSRRGRRPAFPTVGQSALVGGAERRATPWVLLAVVVAVLLIALVFFAFYAEHLVHQHTNGAVSTAVVSVVSAPRL